MSAPSPWKLRFLVTVVTIANPLGNLLLKRGTTEGFFWLAPGVMLLIGWTLTRMALLRRADLSYVLPVTSLGYVVTALLGRFVLAEPVSARRWAGTLLIVAGAALVGATRPATTGRDAA